MVKRARGEGEIEGKESSREKRASRRATREERDNSSPWSN